MVSAPQDACEREANRIAASIMDDAPTTSLRFASLTAVAPEVGVLRANEASDGKPFCTGDPILDLPAVRAAIDLAWQKTKTCREEQQQQFEAIEGESLRGAVALPVEAGGRETYFKVENNQPTPVLCSEFSAHVPREAMNITGATQATFHTHPDASTVREANIVSDAQIAAEEPIPHYVVAQDEVYVLNAPTRRRRWPREKLARPCAEAAADEDGAVLRQADSSGSLADRVAVNASASAPLSGGQRLPQRDRSFMEARFGYDFGAVRIHADARAGRAAASISARAFTVGRDIVFGVGQYVPQTTAGRHLLAHELTHVVQQQAVRPLRAVTPPHVGHRVHHGSIQRQSPSRTGEPIEPQRTPVDKQVVEDMIRRIREALQAAAIPDLDIAATEGALAQLQRMAEGRAFYGVTGQPGADRPPLGEYDPQTDTLTLSTSRFRPGATPGSSQLVAIFHEAFHATRRDVFLEMYRALGDMPTSLSMEQVTPDQLARLIEFHLSMYREEALAHGVDKVVLVAFGVADGVIERDDAPARQRAHLEDPASGTSATEQAGILSERASLYARKIGATMNLMAFMEAAKRYANTGDNRPRVQDFLEKAAALPSPAEQNPPSPRPGP